MHTRSQRDISTPNDAQRAKTSRSPKADRKRCGMVNKHKKCWSNVVKLTWTQRIQDMRGRFPARRLGRIAIRAHSLASFSHEASPSLIADRQRIAAPSDEPTNSLERRNP